MFFVFVEDGSLEIVENIEEIRINYEGIDVESGVYEFFDDKGNRLKPSFTTPNRVKKYFGLFSTVESGRFDLVSDTSSYSDDIYTLLNETRFLKPNAHFKSLKDVKIYLGNKND